MGLYENERGKSRMIYLGVSSKKASSKKIGSAFPTNRLRSGFKILKKARLNRLVFFPKFRVAIYI